MDDWFSPPLVSDMTTLPPEKHHLRVHRRGMTILELTMVVGVILLLTTLMYFAVRAWRIATDRSACIMTQRNIQLAVRSYQNMYGYGDGESPKPHEGGQNIIEHLYLYEFIGNAYYQYLLGEDNCLGGGSYVVANPTAFPAEGQLFMSCSLAESRKHDPPGREKW